jgi:hypothetical protein
MIVKSQAWFTLPLLLLALAPMRLPAADDTTITPTNTAVPPPSTAASRSAATLEQHALVIQKTLMLMAIRINQVQWEKPDPKMEDLINRFQLDDLRSLAALPPDKSAQILRSLAVALYTTSKDDPLAVELLKEFKITYTPGPAHTSATNAPPAAPAP